MDAISLIYFAFEDFDEEREGRGTFTQAVTNIFGAILMVNVEENQSFLYGKEHQMLLESYGKEHQMFEAFYDQIVLIPLSGEIRLNEELELDYELRNNI